MEPQTIIHPPRPRNVLARSTALAFVVVLALAGAASISPVRGGASPPAGTRSPLVPVLVTAQRGAFAGLQPTIEALGGVIDLDLAIIRGVRALIPEQSLGTLRSMPGVRWVSPDRRVLPLAAESTGLTGGGSLRHVARVIDADELWAQGITGQGVDVALIDSGVVPVEGLLEPDSVVNGPDLSFESQSEDLRYLDSYGHGTHMAGIIAGKDADASGFSGIAPGARIFNVKVASASGATDVSQVIAAIEWVVKHRNSDGLHIRVMNLSFGTDSQQDYGIDPLAYAAEIAWRKGIVVVAAAGNTGDSGPLADPAYDPNILAVGAADTHGSLDPSDDTVPDWSSRGTPDRRPDIVAPGAGIVSLKDPGSTLDIDHPAARIGDRFFRGSGTSQAAAVVSGAAALLLQANPDLGPRGVKAALMETAVPVPSIDDAAGSGMIDVSAATGFVGASLRSPRSRGWGSLDASRGSVRVTMGGVILSGEQDIMGAPFDSLVWSEGAVDLLSWQGGMWNGSVWTGDEMGATTWAGLGWSGLSWSGLGWSGLGWSGLGWSGMGWSGLGWSGLTWAGIEPTDTGSRGLGWSSRWGGPTEPDATPPAAEATQPQAETQPPEPEGDADPAD
jgi:subtilisin family serine protease